MKIKIIFSSLLIAILMVTMPGCGAGGDSADNGNGGQFQDGEYTGTAEGYNSQIQVRVIVSGGQIDEIEVLDHNESAGVADNALAQTGQRIIEAQDTDIELVTGATSTSEGIRDAVENALEGARN